ncbi:MAG: ATP-binding cassette domain-containing protein [Gemmatimonadota bacterium]
MDNAALEAVGIIKRYGTVTALDQVSLAVAPGECVALVGESGSGKTTLLRCFNRMVEPDGGQVLVNGDDASRVEPIRLRRHTGYVPQEGGLLPHWRVLRNAAMVPWLLDQPDATTRAAAALDLVGLPAAEYGERWPSELSGGQRQRVAIARALASDPPVILLDEPFGALDAITRGDLQESFIALRRRVPITTLLVTHDLNEAMRLADRIGVMRKGKLEQLASPRELLAHPATQYVQRLLQRAGVVAG